MFKTIKKKINKFMNKKNKKDEQMAQYQGNKLDYSRLNVALNKYNKNKQNKNVFNSIKGNLDNFKQKFSELSDEEKQNELRSDKFKENFNKIKELKNQELNKIIKEIEKAKKLSENEEINEKLENIFKKLEIIENENLNPQGKNIADIAYNLDDIKKIIDTIPASFKSKADFNLIKEEIERLSRKLQNTEKNLSLKIDNKKIPSFPKIPNDYLKKDDFDRYNKFFKDEFKDELEYRLNSKLKDLEPIKESVENLETVPAKIIELDKKIDSLYEKIENLPNINNQKSTKIRKEEKSVIELSQYMKDGITQFENIAKEYISKISELEKLEKLKTNHKKELENTKQESEKKGYEKGQIDLIKKIAENHPTIFKEIKNSFEDLITEKYKKEDVLDINDKNKNGILSFVEFDGEIVNGKYKVISSAILLKNNILFKAQIELLNDEKEKSEEELKNTSDIDNSKKVEE